MPRSFPARTARLAAGALASLLLLQGCDSPPPVSTSTEEATLKGTVTLFGKKATSGQVIIDPSNYKRPNESPRTAEIGPEGTYEAKTLVGANFVRVQHPSLSKTREEMPQLEVDVKPGGTTFEIVLPPSN